MKHKSMEQKDKAHAMLSLVDESEIIPSDSGLWNGWFTESKQSSLHYLVLFIGMFSILAFNPEVSSAAVDVSMFSSQRYGQTKQQATIAKMKDLQDYRLDLCADRGTYWEQCFWFGEKPSSAQSLTTQFPGKEISEKSKSLSKGIPASSTKPRSIPSTW